MARTTFFCAVAVLTALAILPAESDAWQIPDGVTSTQNPKDKPLLTAEAIKRIKLPDGFNVTLFAGEPDIAQPIAFCFDDRGRMWVAECYSYKRWDKTGTKGHDRIVILEDTDQDGQHDKRTIFAEGLANLTGIEIGFDGVWICSAPNLKFIPDANGDDKPDGPAEVKLDGWVIGNVQHNIFNNLTWGPDGWLYGCHGIQDESHVGKPGSKAEHRTNLRCGIWRYHPQKETFEVVCHGTTNPWGLDFNEVGDGFFTNCVIGHLWHMIPGAHYVRMYGEDYNKHAYELIDQHADHLHWAGGKWTDSRIDSPEHSSAGGGHAHVGAMIYQGDNWPAKYRNMIGMVNLHGRRLNFDKLERKGSGYVGRRGEDMFFVDDPWFRGVSVKQGPDGAVYISDWCDLGECHDNDGVHCESGRIYRVVWQGQSNDDDKPASGTPTDTSLEYVKKPFDLRNLKHEEDLWGELYQTNVWWARRARLELQRRAARGDDLSKTQRELWNTIGLNDNRDFRLSALWALHVTDGLGDQRLLSLLDDEDEYVRGWAITFLCEDSAPPAKALEEFSRMATEDSPWVRLKIASVLQRMPIEERWNIVMALVSHAEDNDDHNLPLMIWYGIEPAVAADKSRALKLAGACKLSKIRQFIAKRVTAQSD